MELSGKESKALCEWADVDLSKCTNQLELSGALRNVIRHAEQWGPKLIAMLAVENLIDPDGSPEDALARLIYDYKTLIQIQLTEPLTNKKLVGFSKVKLDV
jgi:hypothetical protein